MNGLVVNPRKVQWYSMYLLMMVMALPLFLSLCTSSPLLSSLYLSPPPLYCYIRNKTQADVKGMLDVVKAIDKAYSATMNQSYATVRTYTKTMVDCVSLKSDSVCKNEYARYTTARAEFNTLVARVLATIPAGQAVFNQMTVIIMYTTQTYTESVL